MPLILRMTTHVCHAREVIKFDAIPQHDFDWTPRFAGKGAEYWPITATVFPMKRKTQAKLAAVARYAEESHFTEHYTPLGTPLAGGQRLGVISAGLPRWRSTRTWTSRA